MKNNTKKLTEYLDKMNIEYTVDYNPSEERISEIKKKLEESENKKTAIIKAGEGKVFNDDLITHLFGN